MVIKILLLFNIIGIDGNIYLYFLGPRFEGITTLAGLRAAIAQGTAFAPDGMPFFAPPFPSVVPLPPVPTPPPNLTALTEEELNAMEGNLRQAVEARIQTLQRVQLLLDAANAMMNQYQTAAATAKCVLIFLF